MSRRQIWLGIGGLVFLSRSLFAESPKSVWVLAPAILVEDAYTEQPVERVEAGTKSLMVSESLRAAQAALARTGVTVILGVEKSTESPAEFDEAQKRLAGHSEDLVKTWKDKSTYSGDFALAKNLLGADAIMVFFIKVKAGASPTYDFILTGSMTPSTSSTAIKAALIDVSSGKSSWSNSVIDRSMPSAGSVKKLLTQLFEKYPHTTLKEK